MTVLDDIKTESELGPAKFESMAHVSLPCRDLDEAIAFYVDVLGGTLRISGPRFASLDLAGASIGLGNVGCTFMTPGNEYPHLAFHVGADAMLHTRRWLAQCGIPMSNMWTRQGKEALMFFRDPSGNVIELYCTHGIKDADKLPRGPSRGHGTAVDVDTLSYTTWKRPKKQGPRVHTPGRGN
jgi:catechol 2,3-dioxygenase-like lactoylglutathione lyase family enzyme